MVGTPRSTGCAVCRKRKKKCGEELPSCIACMLAGMTCPGYTKRWKFMDENGHLSTHYKNKAYIFEEVDVSYRFSLDSATDHRPSRIRRKTKLVLIPSLAASHDYLISSLIYIMEDPVSRVLCRTNCFMIFIRHLPRRLGRNMALDRAVAAFCSIHADVRIRSVDTRKRALNLYSRGLRAVAACIEEEELRCESETICASILLQMCEVLLNQQKSQFNGLNRGSKQLFLESGPKRFIAPFESAMLYSQSTLLIIQDMGDAKDTFLSQPEWQDRLRTLPNGEGTEDVPYLRLRVAFCGILVRIHELILILSGSQSLKNGEANAGVRDAHLSLSAVRINNDIKAWYSGDVALFISRGSYMPLPDLNGLGCIDIAEESHGRVYPDPFIALVDCITSFILLKLETLISRLRPEGRMAGETIFSATIAASHHASIHASYEYLRTRSCHSLKPLSHALEQIGRLDSAL